MRHVLVVLGMHRSGTSALTGAISGCGFALGKKLVPPAPDNPAGYFENATAVDINEELLLALGRGWDDLRPLPGGWVASPAATKATGRIVEWLREEFESDSGIVLKDPRLCLLFPLWRGVLNELRVPTSVVLATRPVSEVVASLATRDDLAPSHACLLWLSHMLAAEHASRGLDRTVVSYGRFVSQPVIEIERCLRDLGMPVPGQELLRNAVSAVDPGKRHHRSPQLDLDDGALRDRLAEAESLFGAEELSSGRFDALRAWLAERLPADAERLQPRAGALNLARRESRAHLAGALEVQRAFELARALAMERLDQLQQLSDTMHTVSELASSRLAEVEDLDRRLALTDAALREATALAEERLVDSIEIDRRLRAAEAALEAASALTKSNLEELREMDGRLGQTAEALAAAEGLAESRLSEIQRLEGQLRDVASALAGAEALAASRLSEVRALDDRLRLADEGLARASALAESRLSEIAKNDRRLRESDTAILSLERLALERLGAVEALDRQVAEERVVRSQLEASIARLESSLAIERAALSDAVSGLVQLQSNLELANERIDSLQVQVQSMEASFSWRMTRPLRWLASRWRGRRS